MDLGVDFHALALEVEGLRLDLVALLLEEERGLRPGFRVQG